MTIAVRGTTGAPNGSQSSGTTLGVANPTGVVAGDVIIMSVCIEGDGGAITAIATPTGFTAVDGNQFTTNTYSAVFIRKADGTEGSTFTVSFTNSSGFPDVTYCTACIAYSGVDGTTQQDVTAVAQSNTSSVNLSAGGIVTVTDNSMIVVVYTWRGTGTFGVSSSGLTSEVNNATSVTNGPGGAIGDKTKATHGSTGTMQCSISTARVSRAVTIALRPASGGGGGASPATSTFCFI